MLHEKEGLIPVRDDVEGLAAEVNRELPEGMMLAYDGLKMEIECK